jgi:hypothetical protein
MDKFRQFLDLFFEQGSDVCGHCVSATKLLHATPFSAIAEVTFEHDGQKSDYSVMLEPGGAGVVLIAADQRIVLVKQTRLLNRTNNWEIPLESYDFPGESAEDCARRAAIEEGGAKDVQLGRKLAAVCPTPRSTDTTTTFIASTEDLGEFDTDELHDRRAFTRDEVISMIRSGEITEGVSLASLGLYFAMI